MRLLLGTLWPLLESGLINHDRTPSAIFCQYSNDIPKYREQHYTRGESFIRIINPFSIINDFDYRVP